MSTTVYLVRHAEAEGNLGRRCHGIYNSLLTPLGRQQAKAVGNRFRTIHLDAVYSSDLSRARDTAREIARPHGLDVQERKLLREINMGEWEDKPWAELPVFQPEAYDTWCNRPWECQPPKGETIMQAGQRVFDELQVLAKENDGKTIAVVSHGTVTRGVLTLACGFAPQEMNKVGWGDNTCVARLVYLDDGTLRVDYRNDNSHLEKEISTFSRLKWSSSVDVPVSPQLWFRPVNWDDAADKALVLELFHSIYWPTYGKEAFPDAHIEEYLKGFQSVTPEVLVFGMLDREPVGVIALNTIENRDTEIGEMGGTGILPKFRGYGFAPQFMEHAVSTYRKMGKTKLQAKPSAHNPHGPKFYMSNGFVKVGEIENGDFVVLQRELYSY